MTLAHVQVHRLASKLLHTGVAAASGWPYLVSTGPVARSWAPNGATPASLLAHIGALLPSLAGHRELDTPFAGLGENTRVLATLGLPYTQPPAPGLTKIRPEL